MIATTEAWPLLGEGDEGEAVARLQRLLRRAGPYDLKTDGEFGGRTTRALRQLQRHHGLPVDGRLSKALWALIEGLASGKALCAMPSEARDPMSGWAGLHWQAGVQGWRSAVDPALSLRRVRQKGEVLECVVEVLRLDAEQEGLWEACEGDLVRFDVARLERVCGGFGAKPHFVVGLTGLVAQRAPLRFAGDLPEGRGLDRHHWGLALVSPLGGEGRPEAQLEAAARLVAAVHVDLDLLIDAHSVKTRGEVEGWGHEPFLELALERAFEIPPCPVHLRVER
jgi:hypothetical protein